MHNNIQQSNDDPFSKKRGCDSKNHDKLLFLVKRFYNAQFEFSL